MADKHGLNYDVRELKLGASFTNNKASQYHTIKYDFKPASVDLNKISTVDVGTNNQVTVTVPHLDGAGVPQTVFKGSQRPYTKECVLIIDRVTGEITLEKLSSNIQVKKTRQESSQKPRPLTPVTADFTNVTQRSTSRTRVATNKRTANPPPGMLIHHLPSVFPVAHPAPRERTQGPLVGPSNAGAASNSNSQARFSGQSSSSQKTTTNIIRSPPRVKASPPQAPSWSSGGNSTLASLPMIGLDDALGPAPPQPSHNSHQHNGYPPPAPVRHQERPPPERQTERHPERSKTEKNLYPMERNTNIDRSQSVPQIPSLNPPPLVVEPPQADSSSSSSSDSDSGSGSDSDSDDNDSSAHHSLTNNGNPTLPSLPSDVLNDDLCLSESGSDSD